MNEPLKGVKVVDLTYFVAGPGSAKILGDWGADVVKVEPIFGDPMRMNGVSLNMPIEEDCNPLYSTVNNNKKGIALNLKAREGQEIMHKLLAEADVFVSSYRTGALKRLGLDYESLKEKYPRLIWAQVNGFGDDGPLKDEPGFDTVAYWARSGAMIDLAEKGSPIVPPFGFGDSSTALALAGGISAALYQQQKTGKGQKVLLSLLSNAIWSMSCIVAAAQYGDEYPKSRKDAMSAVINNYMCKDGQWITVTILDYERYYLPLLRALEIEEYANDERFNSEKSAKKNGKELIALLDKAFQKFDREEVIKRLKAEDIAYGKVQHLKDLPTDPQVLENNYLIKVKNRDGSEYYAPMSPVRFGTTEIERKLDAPLLGEHNDEILRGLGYSEEEISRLYEVGAIYKK